MKLTVNHSFAILSRITYINENLCALLDNCKGSQICCGIDEVQDLIFEAERNNVLVPDLEIGLDCESLTDTLKQIAKGAEENGNLVLFLDAHRTCQELKELALEIKR